MTKVLVYSTPSCPWCKKAKEFLTDKGVEYEDVDVSKDEKAMADMLQKTDGKKGVPVLDINGIIVRGFDQDEIMAALAQSLRDAA